MFALIAPALLALASLTGTGADPADESVES